MKLARLLVILLLPAFVFAAPVDASADEGYTYRETIGALAAGFMYHSHVFIGAVSDAHLKRTYTKKQVADLMRGTNKMSAGINKQLRKVLRLNIPYTEKRDLRKIMDIIRLIGREATAVRRFVYNKSRHNANRYERLRKRTWRKISKMLGIN